MKPGSSRLIIPAFITLLVVGVLGIIWLTPQDRQESVPHLHGRIWTSAESAEPRVYYLTQEERTSRQLMGSRRYVSRYRLHPYSLYHLESRRLTDGETAGTTWTIRVPGSVSSSPPEIIGVASDGLWLWNDGLQVHDLDNLQMRMDAVRLAELNPELANRWPDQPKDVKVVSSLGGLVFKASDLRWYKLDAITGKATELEENQIRMAGQGHSPTAIFDSLESAGKSRGAISEHHLMTTGFSLDKTHWYGLLTEEQASEMGRRPRVDDRPWGEAWREYYTADVKGDHRNRLEFVAGSIRKDDDIRLLNAGFLQKSWFDPWLVSDPPSVLVLHRKDLKKESPWWMARLSLDGEMLWDVSLGLCEIMSVSDGETTMALYGYRDRREPLSERPDLLVLVNTVNGLIVERKLSPGGRLEPDIWESFRDSRKTGSYSQIRH